MIKRDAEKQLIRLSKTFKLVSLTGPRQTGKTTLVRAVFKDKPYINLENPDTRRFASEDPRGFLDTYPDGAVLDEVQRVPELFAWLQERADHTRNPGMYILTGSNNFLMQQEVSQSLAGRTGSLVLLPFSLGELSPAMRPLTDDEMIITGFYPPVYDQKIPPQDWCPNYIRTYIERDVRQIRNIVDLLPFQRFLSLLAGRCSQELNMSALSVEAGVDNKTIQAWIGLLESSYLIFLLKPHSVNFNKTIVKRPKVYFYDTALACSLLGIYNTSHLQTHPARGALFENMLVSEISKFITHSGSRLRLFYWREKSGHEIDLLIERDGELLPLEIKSGKTIHSEHFRNLDYYRRLSGAAKCFLIYGGEESQKRSNGTEVINWRKFVTNL